MTMDYKQFQEWLSGIDQLSPAFLGAPDTSASLAAVEASVGEEDGQCAHCGTAGAVSRGKARGLRRIPEQGVQKGIVPDDVDQALVGVARLNFGEKLRCADAVDGGWVCTAGFDPALTQPKAGFV